MDVQELVVRAVPEGVSDTVDSLDKMNDRVEESTDEMEEQAESMSDLSKEFAGGMTTAAVGLAVAAGSLLTQVPVIGEAFSALGAVVSAIAFQIDNVLRPALVPFIELGLEAADTIYELDGAAGTALGVLGALAVAFSTVVLPAATLASKLGLAVSTKAALIGAGKALIGALATVASALSLPLVAVGLLVAGLALLAWHFREEIVDAVHTAIDHLGNLTEWFTDAVSDAVDWGADLIGGWIDGITSVGLQDAVDFVTGLADTFTDLVSDAWGWGTDLISEWVQAIQNVSLSDAISFIGRIKETITDMIDNAVEWGSDLVSGLISGIRSKVSDLSDTMSDVGETISEYLPGSDAETGPLSNLTTQGAGLISGLVSGADTEDGSLSNFLESFLQGFIDRTSSVFESLRRRATATRERILTAFDGLLPDIEPATVSIHMSGLETAVSKVRGFVSKVRNISDITLSISVSMPTVDGVHALDSLLDIAQSFTSAFRSKIESLTATIPTPELNLSEVLDTIDGFTNHISDFVNTIGQQFAGLAQTIRELVNQSLADLQRLDRSLTEDVSGSLSVQIESVRRESESENGENDFIGSVGGGRVTINLDGRNIENTQGRYRADNLHRRGG